MLLPFSYIAAATEQPMIDSDEEWVDVDTVEDLEVIDERVVGMS